MNGMRYLLIAIVAAILFIPFLGAVHLFDWDEINFAESAREMIVTGDMINAEDALKWGLANYVVTPEELLAKCFEITAKISAKSPTAIRTAIKVINAGFNTQLNGYEVEIEEFGKSFGTADFKEGVKAFLEKRAPAYQGK